VYVGVSRLCLASNADLRDNEGALCVLRIGDEERGAAQEHRRLTWDLWLCIIIRIYGGHLG
jgi:hypothetical protein